MSFYPMKNFLFCRCIVLLFFLASCSNSFTESEIEGLNNAYTKWKSFEVKDYTFTQWRECFCIDAGRKATLIVKAGVIVEGFYEDSGQKIEREKLSNYKTIDQLFEMAYKIPNERPVSYELQFDPQFGFPTIFYIDPSAGNDDEEIRFVTSKVIMTK